MSSEKPEDKPETEVSTKSGSANDGKASPAPAPMSPDDIALLLRFREKFLPDTRITTYDNFAKWLFGLTATVAALGAGLSNTAFSKLTGLGIVAYGIAVLLSGAGLAVATFALSIDLPDANWASLGAMFKAMKNPLKEKRLTIRTASILLALALAAASAAPLISLFSHGANPPSSGLIYSFSSSTVEAAFTQEKVKPHTSISLRISSTDTSQKEVLLAGIFSIVAANGIADIHIPKIVVPGGAASLRIVAELDEGSGPKQKTAEIVIQPVSQPLKPGAQKPVSRLRKLSYLRKSAVLSLSQANNRETNPGFSKHETAHHPL